jgi:hypothetical protein
MSADQNTIPMQPVTAASQPTKPAQKKRSPLGVALVVLGVVIVLAVLALVGRGVLNNLRDRRTDSTATAAASAGQPATSPPVAAPTDAPLPTQAPAGASPVASPDAGQGAGRVLFEDHFDGGAIDPRWQWRNEPPQGGWAVEDGRLRLNLIPNTHVADTQNVNGKPTAPMLLVPVPNGTFNAAFRIQVDVTIHPATDYEQAGIVILDDGQRAWFNLVRAHCSHQPPQCSGDAIYLDDWRSFLVNPSGYTAPQSAGGTLPQDGPVTLRLTVQARRATAEYSLDGGVGWHSIGEWPIRLGNQVGYIGLVASPDSATETNNRAYFDNFLITPAGAQ